MRDECIRATPLIELMRNASWGHRQDTGGISQAGHTPELLFLPQFAPHLGNAAVTGVARAMLDTHVRVAQNHIRHVMGSSDVALGDGIPVADWMSERSRVTHDHSRDRRLWHTVSQPYEAPPLR